MALRVALDTNAYSDFMRGVAERVRVVQAAARVYLPLFVLGELRAGFKWRKPDPPAPPRPRAVEAVWRPRPALAA